MKEFNKQIAGLAPSRSMAMMAKAKEMKKIDPSIIGLGGGEPDFSTPDRIIMEAIRWMSNGYTHYTVGAGLPELRARIARKLNEENGCHYNADQIVVAPGGKMAIYLAVRALVNPGDEVIFFNPGWVSYPSIVEASGAVSVPVQLDYKNDYKITAEALEKAVSDKTRMLIINYPNNPTGRLLHADDMAVLKAFLQAHPDVYLLSDEMYERIIFDGKKNISPATDPEIADQIITVNGFSKSVAMTGWRIGYLAAASAVVKVIMKLHQHTITCVSGFMQKAATVALDCQEEIETMRKRYDVRRKAFVGALNKISGVHCAMPEGAFYAWVRFDIPGWDSEKTCDYILSEAKVVGVPGVSYGEENAAYIRFSFASADEDLDRAAQNITAAMEKLAQKA